MECIYQVPAEPSAGRSRCSRLQPAPAAPLRTRPRWAARHAPSRLRRPPRHRKRGRRRPFGPILADGGDDGAPPLLQAPSRCAPAPGGGRHRCRAPVRGRRSARLPSWADDGAFRHPRGSQLHHQLFRNLRPPPPHSPPRIGTFKRTLKRLRSLQLTSNKP